ncbi:hypothetical protein E2562_019971 [Oryza meyeriana var. granulata]|uniref:F-box domain-containing protein n=1 Tax=Oryza meyeriana var. granulata TaxID=110450 RepID=A0A6G1CHF0_9ORYZ|nr:hypothetical protein E2562_019971 [Oryza meyeriana var. granulata]
MAEMGAAAAVPVIPEDVVIEILARVPDPTSLFRCAAVCRRWRRLIAEPAFLRRRWPRGTGGAALLGFFAQRHQIQANARRKLTKLFPTRAPALVAAPDRGRNPPIGLGRRLFLTDFVRDDGATAGIFDQAKPVAARGGLLLMRVFPRAPSPPAQNVLHLCVCNLLTGKHDVLPPLQTACFDDDGVRGYAILTATDHRISRIPSGGYNTFFQVLLLGIHNGDHQVYLHRFFSTTATAIMPPSWSTPTNCSERTLGRVWGPYGNRVAAVSNGTAHWLFHGEGQSLYTLDVSIDADNIGATKLPLDALPIAVRMNRSSTWFRLETQGGPALWFFTQAIPVVAGKMFLGMESLSSVCIGEKSGTMLTLYHSDQNRAYVLNLPSGVITRVADWKRWFNYLTAVPFEINWPIDWALFGTT